MERAYRRAAALALAALLALPSAALAAAPDSGAPLEAGPRLPDFAALDDDRADLSVQAPAPVRAPLAAPNNWTVLVYMVADNNLESYALQDLNEMEAAPAAAGVRVVVQVDRSANYDTGFGNWVEARRYLIAHDTDPNALTSTMVQSLGEVNMGDPQVLADFLAWGEATYPADHTMVVLWDHGFGWKGFGDDYGDNDHLSLTELRSALEAGAEAQGRPFDIVAFDACLMQSVEVAYEFAFVADYLVAAEDLEPGPGWPYDKVLAPLSADPSIAPEDLAGAVVRAYLEHYGPQGEAMMSAVRLSEVRVGLNDALNSLAAEIAAVAENPQTAASTSPERAVWDARSGSPAMYTGELIDLGEFLRLLSEDARLPDSLRLAAALAREALNTSVVEEGHSVYYVGWSGMSIHFPTIQVAPLYAQSRFAVDGFWDNAMNASLTGVAAGGARPTAQVQSPASNSAVGPRFSASASAATGAGDPVRLEYKAGWRAYATIASGSAPLSFSGILDTLHSAGPWPVSFRAVAASGVPSTTVERRLLVEPSPAALSPAFDTVALAVNRTRTLNLTVAPRPPYQSFDIGWIGLPPNISGTGTTGSASFPQVPAPPFNITLALAVAPGSPEGRFAATLFVRSAAVPSVVAYLDLDLEVTQPLPDLEVGALALSQDLPLPGELVDAAAEVENAGFEEATAARLVAEFRDVNGALAEVANFSIGPLAPGAAFAWSWNFTALRGTQELTVRAILEAPLLGELNLSNNARTRTVVIVNYSVALAGPSAPVLAALGGSATPVEFAISNLGTEDDRYDLSVLSVTNASWQAGLRASFVDVGGRNASTITVDVLPPPAAQGGDEITFEVRALSRADGAVEDAALVRVEVSETYNATLRPAPAALTLPAGGTGTVTLTLQNTGNGVEDFVVAVEGADPHLGARFDLAAFTLSPGQPGAARLTLTDGGLTSADRPYTVEAVAVSTSSGARFSAIISVSIAAAPSLTVGALEPSIQADVNGSSLFHVRVANSGNTNVIASLSAASSFPGLLVAVPAEAERLEPGASVVLEGTSVFGVAPRAGNYSVSFRAADALTGTNATGAAQIAVPAVHDLRASLAVVGGGGPRVLVRTITIENHGNAAERVTVIIGAVDLRTTLEVTPSIPNSTFSIEPGGALALTLTITGKPDTGASGSIEVVLQAQGGSVSLPFQVSFDFTAPPPPPILEWAAVVALASLGIAAWAIATRRRGAARP